MLKRIGRVLIVVFGLITVAQATPPDQPFMEAARTDLQRARAELQLATRDKAGHRGKAVNLVSQAIGEVNAGIQYARRHNRKCESLKQSFTVSFSATAHGNSGISQADRHDKRSTNSF